MIVVELCVCFALLMVSSVFPREMRLLITLQLLVLHSSLGSTLFFFYMYLLIEVSHALPMVWLHVVDLAFICNNEGKGEGRFCFQTLCLFLSTLIIISVNISFILLY